MLQGLLFHPRQMLSMDLYWRFLLINLAVPIAAAHVRLSVASIVLLA